MYRYPKLFIYFYEKKTLKACCHSFFSSFIFFLGAFRNTGYQRSFQNLQVASSDRSTLKFCLERFTVYIFSFGVFRKFAQKFVLFWNCKLSFLAIKWRQWIDRLFNYLPIIYLGMNKRQVWEKEHIWTTSWVVVYSFYIPRLLENHL